MADHEFHVIQREIDGGTYLYVADRALEGIREHEEAVHDAFEGLSEKHVKAAGGLLSLLPYDPEKYPFQRLDVVEARVPERASVSVLESFAEMAYPEYPRLKKQFMRPKNDQVFRSLLEGLNSGQDYALLFDHGRIINTPLGKIAAMARLESTADEMDIQVPDYNARITISKLLSRFKAMGLPAVNILAQVGIVGMSLPPSETVRKVIPKPVRENLNESFKEVRQHPEVEEIPSEDPDKSEYGIREGRDKPVMDSYSGSGTVDVYVPGLLAKQKGQKSAVHMGPLSWGTAELMGSSRVLPISVHVNHSRPKSAVGTIHEPPKDKGEADALMVAVSHLAKEASGAVHRYHPTRESFVEAITKKSLKKPGNSQQEIDPASIDD